MARQVTHTESGPLKLDADDLDEEKGNVAICQCGLSASRPFCDGSHRSVADEADGVLYEYENDDDEGERRVVERVVYAEE